MNVHETDHSFLPGNPLRGVREDALPRFTLTLETVQDASG